MYPWIPHGAAPLWRVLLAQKLTYDALVASHHVDRAAPADLVSLIPTMKIESVRALDWRRQQSGDMQDRAGDDAVNAAVAAARAYVADSVKD